MVPRRGEARGGICQEQEGLVMVRDFIPSGMELILHEELREGKTFTSAADFHEQCMKTRSSYIVMDNDATEEEIQHARDVIQKSDALEIERLQKIYARQWQ
jgi:hypothetical protein